MSEPIIRLRDIDIVFGSNPSEALPLIDAGESRSSIAEKTGQVVGVQGATLDIHEGEIVVLMGLSGSGKSTLLRAINGLNPIARGDLQVFGKKGEAIHLTNCKAKTLRQLRSEWITMVFQQFALLPWRTVADNVGLGLELCGVGAKERQKRVVEKLRLVGLEEWAQKFVHELSGGMQQRVGLARAFATDAPILLLDEPFSALDPLIRGKLQDELLELQKSLRRTMVFVSHDLDEAFKMGSRIVLMEGGRIVQVGTPRDIIFSPANSYVAEFVAHMNPIGVLRAADIMSPVDRISYRSDCTGWAMENRQLVQPDGCSASYHALHKEGQEGNVSDMKEGHVVCAPRSASLNDLMRGRLMSKLPIVIQDGDAIVGLVGDEEIYGALIGQKH